MRFAFVAETGWLVIFAKTTDVQFEFPAGEQGKADRVIWSVGEGANEAKRDK